MEFNALRKQLSPVQPCTFVVKPPVGRIRAAAVLNLADIVLACVRTSKQMGLFKVTHMIIHIHVVNVNQPLVLYLGEGGNLGVVTIVSKTTLL